MIPVAPRPPGATHVLVGITLGVHFWARRALSGRLPYRWEMWSPDAGSTWRWVGCSSEIGEHRFVTAPPAIPLPGIERPPGATHVLRNEYEPFRFWARRAGRAGRYDWLIWARPLGGAEFSWTERGAACDDSDYVELTDPATAVPLPYEFSGDFASVRLEPPTSEDAKKQRLFKLVDGRFSTWQSADRLRAWLDEVFPGEPR